MLESILRTLNMPPELGFGLFDLIVVSISLALSLRVLFSSDTHGWVTFGYRVPFNELPASARSKVHIAILWAIGTISLILYRLA